MMNLIQSAVARHVRTMGSSDVRGFYFAADGDLKVLHITRKKVSAGKFKDARALSKHLEQFKKIPGYSPYSDKVRFCSGTVKRSGDQLLFLPRVFKGVQLAELKKGLKTYKSKLKPCTVLVQRSEPEPEPEAPPKEAASPAAEEARAAEVFARRVLSAGSMSDADLFALVEEIRQAKEAGAALDTRGLIRPLSEERARRKQEEEDIRREAIVPRLPLSRLAELSDRIRALHALRQATPLGDLLATLQERLQDAAPGMEARLLKELDGVEEMGLNALEGVSRRLEDLLASGRAERLGRSERRQVQRRRRELEMRIKAATRRMEIRASELEQHEAWLSLLPEDDQDALTRLLPLQRRWLHLKSVRSDLESDRREVLELLNG